MTKQEFLTLNDLLCERGLDELDRVEVWLGYEKRTGNYIPDEWFEEVSLLGPIACVRNTKK